MVETGNGDREDRKRYVDLVSEGGGVKGIALVGAFSVLEKRGYEPQNMAGASAVAIVAALIAAGYRADELKEIVANLDYDQFKDQAIEDRLPMGRTLSILKDLGIYEGWMRGLLEARGVRTFGNLVRRKDVDLKYRYKLQVIASDVTERRLLVLPRDSPSLCIEHPDDLDVARAVRMSMSIPIFFEPVRFTNRRTDQEHLIVDGGMLSNFPVWLFDAEEPQWPTIGMKLTRKPEAPIGGELAEPVPHGGVTQAIGYLRSLVDTIMAAHDRLYVDQHDFDERTIGIGTLGVGTTEFDLSPDATPTRWRAGGRDAALSVSTSGARRGPDPGPRLLGVSRADLFERGYRVEVTRRARAIPRSRSGALAGRAGGGYGAKA